MVKVYKLVGHPNKRHLAFQTALGFIVDQQTENFYIEKRLNTLDQALVQILRVAQRARSLRQGCQTGHLGDPPLLLLVDTGVLDGDGSLARKDAEHLQVVLAEGICCERGKLKSSCRFASNQQRDAQIGF